MPDKPAPATTPPDFDARTASAADVERELAKLTRDAHRRRAAAYADATLASLRAEYKEWR